MSSSTSGRGSRSTSTPDRVASRGGRPRGAAADKARRSISPTALLVGAADYQPRAVVGEQLLEGDDLARDVLATCEHDVE